MNTEGLEILGTQRAVGSPWQETYYVSRCSENHTQEVDNFITQREIANDLKQSKSTWDCGCFLIHELKRVEVNYNSAPTTYSKSRFTLIDKEGS